VLFAQTKVGFAKEGGRKTTEHPLNGIDLARRGVSDAKDQRENFI